MTPQEKIEQAVATFPKATVSDDVLVVLYERAFDAVRALQEVSGARSVRIDVHEAEVISVSLG